MNADRIGFYVSGQATRFKRYIGFLSNAGEELPGRIKVVVTDNPGDEELFSIARKHGIPLEAYDGKGRDREALSHLILNRYLDAGIQYGFVFGGRVLVGKLLEKYRSRLINFHPSVLPAFKGRKAIDQARQSRAYLLGNTAHFVTADLDGGPVIMQSLLHHSRYEDYDSVLDDQLPMLMQIIKWLDEDRVRVADGYVLVQGADYIAGRFVPALEIDSRLFA